MALNREEAHQLVDKIFDGVLAPPAEEPEPNPETENPKKETPEGKRVVRTKSSGDRVYLLDDVKKTRQWVTSPEILESVGFDLDDVQEVDDSELLRYQMSAALYRVENAK